jgi:hypothetical protein
MQQLLEDLEVPDEVHQYRLKICQGCPQVMNESDNIKTARCGKCGCFVNVKSGLKDFTCPAGKW